MTTRELEVTERYLKDNVFSGYTPQFIARELFERGVFGFIPHILLKIYKGRDYGELRLDKQTALIGKVGVSPAEIEDLVRANQSSLIRAQESINRAVGMQGGIRSVLRNITCGNAVSKDEDAFCLMTACGRPCADNSREGCLGCRYEIYTKALLHRMTGEYERLKTHFGDPDGWRYQAIAREAIMPMIGEFITTMKENCGEKEMDALTEIMKGGLAGYDGCGESRERQEL